MRPAMLAALLALPTLAAGQSLAEACAQVTSVTVGHWAEYRITSPEMGGQPMQMRMAVIGREAVDGEEHHWHEMQMDTPQGRVIMQMLVPAYPYEPGDIKGMIMKAPGQPAMRMPDNMIRMMADRTAGANPTADMAAECAAAEIVGTETITTEAGSIETLHLRATSDEVAEIWVSVSIPFGIVRVQAGDGTSMELLGHGTDATSAITETPVTMPGG